MNYDDIEARAVDARWTLAPMGDGYWIDSLAALHPVDEPGVWTLTEIGRHGAQFVSHVTELEAGLRLVRLRRATRRRAATVTGHVALGVRGGLT